MDLSSDDFHDNHSKTDWSGCEVAIIRGIHFNQKWVHEKWLPFLNLNVFLRV
jgi:hypothetical protein